VSTALVPTAAAALYPALVGAAWDGLPAPVRAIHALPPGAVARGVVTVRRGTNLLARLVGAVLGLPAAGEGVATELRVTPLPRGQRWTRRFAGVALVSD